MSRPREGFCDAVIILTVPNPTVMGNPTLQYFIGATPITGAIILPAGLTTPTDIQNVIDADPTYQASNTTILVTDFVSNQLTVTIRKASTSQILDNGQGIYNGDVIDTEPFTCNLASRNGGGNWAIMPLTHHCAWVEWEKFGCPEIMVFNKVEYKYSHREEDGRCCFQKVMPFYRYYGG